MLSGIMFVTWLERSFVKLKQGCIPTAIDAVHEVLYKRFPRESVRLMGKLENFYPEVDLSRADEVHPDLSIADRLAMMKAESQMDMAFQEPEEVDLTDDEILLMQTAVRTYCEDAIEGTWDHLLKQEVL